MSTINTGTPSAATGTNVYVNLLLLIGSIFGGMSDSTATLIVAAGSGVIGAFFAIRNWIVNAKFSLNKSWIGDPNNWAYLTAVIVGLVPAASGLIEPLKGLAQALVAGNWGAIITGAVTLISLIYYTFFAKKT